MMFGLNIVTFPRAYKSDVAMLKSNVATFQGRFSTDVATLEPTSLRAQRRDVIEAGVFGVHSMS